MFETVFDQRFDNDLFDSIKLVCSGTVPVVACPSLVRFFASSFAYFFSFFYIVVYLTQVSGLIAVASLAQRSCGNCASCDGTTKAGLSAMAQLAFCKGLNSVVGLNRAQSDAVNDSWRACMIPADAGPSFRVTRDCFSQDIVAWLADTSLARFVQVQNFGLQ